MAVQLRTDTIRYPTQETWERNWQINARIVQTINNGAPFSLLLHKPLYTPGLITPYQAWKMMVLVRKGHRSGGQNKMPLRIFMQACDEQFQLPFCDNNWFRILTREEVEKDDPIRWVDFLSAFKNAFPGQFKGYIIGGQQRV